MMNKKITISLYIILGAALGVIATALIQSDYRINDDTIHMDIGRDPIYPINLYSSSDTIEDGVDEIVIDPEDPRMDGLIVWLSGISAVPDTNSEAPLEFDLEVWKARPTTQTSVLVQNIEGRELILVMRGSSVINYVANHSVTYGFISDINRSPHYELQMLVCPGRAVPEADQNVGHPPSQSEDTEK